MFGPRKGDENENQEVASVSTGSTPAQAQPRMATPASPRRISNMPAGPRKDVAGDRELIVGPGLSLAGEITSCDILVVEGKVEAKLTDGKLLKITESGQFRGAVEIENADIAGRYDGQLVVHGRLTVRSTGRISGMVKYGELEVNAGGQIIGEVQVTGGGTQAQQGSGFKNAAKFMAVSEEDEAESAEQRKAS